MFCTHTIGAIACASVTCSAVALLTPRCRIRPCCWSSASVPNGSASEPGWGLWALPSRRLTTSSTSRPEVLTVLVDGPAQVFGHSGLTAPDDARPQDLGRDAHGRCARQPRDVRHPHRLNRGAKA